MGGIRQWEEGRGRWSNRRGMSTPVALVIMLVVVVVVGALGYVGLNATQPGSVSKSSCQPANSPACIASLPTHDLTLLVPFRTVQQGNLVPFTTVLPSGETATQFNVSFGDGSYSSSTSPTVQHTYSNPGTYVASTQALVAGTWHDNYRSLVVVTVSGSYQATSGGSTPSVSGAITANTSSTTTPTAVISPNGFVTVAGSYTGAPTNPLFATSPPTLTYTGGSNVTESATASTNVTAGAQFAYSQPGNYLITFVGKSIGPGGAVAYQNYTWSVFVAPSGLNAGASAAGSATNKHPGSLVIYEYAPGGSTSEDPAVDYETLGYEVMLNVYQTLISYNGSQTGPTYTSFVPQIATCVPGSPACTQLYGSSLITADNKNFTFVINSASRFYDPHTGANWPVYPSDVVFSLARTMGFATQPCYTCNNGWIVTQALLSSGNQSWDGGIHGPRNNTPQSVFASMSVNDSRWCPAAAMSGANGCVTFHANGNGQVWPYFLELISTNLGSSIVPAGFFSGDATNSGNAGIPYWTWGNVSGAGDHPVLLPGGATSTNSSAFQSAVAAMPITGWDQWEGAGSSPPFLGNVQWNMAGSGPYFLKGITPGQTYALQANPAYAPNPNCNYQGCQPAKGHYAGNVSVIWETTQIPGEQAYQAGTADFAGIPSTDTALMLQLIQQGKISALSFPSISIFFFPINMNFDINAARTYTSNPITIPSDFMSHVGLRQFLVHAYPYTTIQNSINVKSGIQFFFPYGGAIPQFMANYYATNVSWPTGDPVTDASVAGSAAWWWQQATTSGNPFSDPELTACTTANPCEFPMFGQTGAPDLDQRISLWAQSVNSMSGGKLKMDPLDINFIQLVLNSLYSGPYSNPMPIYQLGWAPDYPDPTDYVAPLYVADGSYTASDTVLEQLSTYNASNCRAWNDYAGYAADAVSNLGIADACQGPAYAAMQLAMQIAAVTPASDPARVLLYNEVSQIANGLALYVYWGQQNAVYTFASYIDPTSINTNVTIGGGADQTWYTIAGTGVWGS